MLRIKHLFALVGGLCAVGALTLATDAEAGSDKCKNVSFEFANEHVEGRAVKVQEVQYFDKGDGKWRTADVTDITCDIHATCKTAGVDLLDLEQEHLTKVRLTFRYKEKDGDWSDPVTGGVKEIASPNVCNANKTYGGLTITGK